MFPASLPASRRRYGIDIDVDVDVDATSA